MTESGDSKKDFNKQERKLLRQSRKLYKIWIQDGEQSTTQILNQAFEFTKKRFARLQRRRRHGTLLEPPKVPDQQSHGTLPDLPKIPKTIPDTDHAINSAILRTFLEKLMISTSLTGSKSDVPHSYLVEMSRAVYAMLVAWEQKQEHSTMVIRPAADQAPTDDSQVEMSLMD